MWPRNATSTFWNLSGVMSPAWTRATTTSASPDSLSFVATALVVATGSFQVMPAMPSGLTRFGISAVTVPMKATFTPSSSFTSYGLVPLTVAVFAAR